ncbi:MAG TPA: hypothetical protein VF774_00360 [Pseudoduganella sp.]
MNGFTDTAKQDQSSFSLIAFLTSLFNLELRDKLSEQQPHQEEGAYTWGL